MVGEVLLGVAGWSYQDWKGIVYPRSCKDTLRAVAERVALIEVNSTFYGMPSAKNSRSWVERTVDLGTRFTAKLPREFTHQRAFDAKDVAAVREGLAPLVASGRLLGLLAQFDHSLHFDAAAMHLLARLRDAFAGDTRLFVEVRHKSWNAAAALDAVADLGLGVLELDYPGAVGGFSLDVSGVRADGIAYFRLHGRNRAWFRRGATRDEVYDWEYVASEVEQIAARIERIRATARHALVVANNHFHGKAMKLVEDLLAWFRRRAAEPGV
jgi:uncharacterized protein YecE (DUF72 family)